MLMWFSLAAILTTIVLYCRHAMRRVSSMREAPGLDDCMVKPDIATGIAMVVSGALFALTEPRLHESAPAWRAAIESFVSGAMVPLALGGAFACLIARRRFRRRPVQDGPNSVGSYFVTSR